MCDPPSKWPRSLKQLRIAWQCRVWCFAGWKVRTRQDGSFQCQSYGSLHRKLKPQLFVDLRMKASPSNFTECYRNSWSLEGVFLSFFWGGVVSARNHPAGGTLHPELSWRELAQRGRGSGPKKCCDAANVNDVCSNEAGSLRKPSTWIIGLNIYFP